MRFTPLNKRMYLMTDVGEPVCIENLNTAVFLSVLVNSKFLCFVTNGRISEIRDRRMREFYNNDFISQLQRKGYGSLLGQQYLDMQLNS